MSAHLGLGKLNLLFLVDGFSEAQATWYISELRGAGLLLKTMGLTRQPVQSEHGVAIVPDLSIDAIVRAAPQIALLILPGGVATTSIWRADPRFRCLLELVYNQKGYLVATHEELEVLKHVQDLSFGFELCRETKRPPGAPLEGICVLLAVTGYNQQFMDELRKLLT